MFMAREMALWEVLGDSPQEEHPFCGGYPGLLRDLLLSPLQLTVIFLRNDHLSLVLGMLLHSIPPASTSQILGMQV